MLSSVFIVRGKKYEGNECSESKVSLWDQMQERMHGQVCKIHVCCGFCSKQRSAPALMKSTDQHVKGTSSVLIYLNLPVEDQYEILIPEREKLLMWPLTMSEVSPRAGLSWWFVDSLEHRQYRPYSCEVSLHLHQRSSFLFVSFQNGIINMGFFSFSMVAAQAQTMSYILN